MAVQLLDLRDVAVYPYIKYDNTEFLRLPPLVEDIEKTLDTIKNMDIRPNDVLLCSPMKTGTHWIHTILSMLLAQRTDYCLKGNVASVNIECSTGYIDWEKYEDPRLFHSHLPYRYLPRPFINGPNKVIYINRNPKDRWVSLYTFYEGKVGFPSWKWDEFFEDIVMKDNLFDGWFEYTKVFEKISKENRNVFKITFEELKIQPFKTVEKVAEFLGVNFTKDFIKDIVQKCSIFNLRESDVDSTRGIHPNYESTLFRKGEIGDWKHWFTVSQNERFEELMNRKMAETDVKFVYTDDNDHASHS